MAKPFSTALALRELATPAGNPPAGTRWFYLKADGKLYTKDSTGAEGPVDTSSGGGGGDPIAPITPTEPAGAVEGLLWYDSDDDEFLVDVSYVQDNEPTGAAEGALWLDTDDPAAHTDADHTGLATVDHTHDLSAYATTTALTSGLAGKSDTSHTHGSIQGVDGRGTVQAPSAFTTATARSRFAPRFHTGAELGLPRAYYAVETITPWSDDSGGGVHQVARGYGETWERYGLRSGAWGPWRVPGGGWQTISTINPSGTSNAIGNCRFTNIPTIYKRLRVRSSYLQYGATSNSGSLTVRFNGAVGTYHYGTMQYASTGSWTGTSYAGSDGAAYAAYNYFYAGASSVYNVFEMEIANHGLGEVNWRAEHRAHTGAGAAYVYRSQCAGHWNSATKVTTIDFWTDTNAYTWNSNSVLTLEGSLEI